MQFQGVVPGAGPQWAIRLFGGWQLMRDDAVPDVASRERRLLSVLALQDGRPRSYLAGLLWPESDETRALGNLRAALWRVQHRCQGLIADEHALVRLDRSVRVDVLDLIGLADQIALGELPDRKAAMVVLTSGDLLPGWYDDWVIDERERLHQVRLRALESLTDLLIARGDADGALHAAMTAASIEPLRESAHRALIRVHLMFGNHVDAVRVYRSFHRRLSTDLGISPSSQIVDLIRPLIEVRTATPQRTPSPV